MAESTLSKGYPDFCAEVGYYLGYGRSSSNWSSDQTTEIGEIVKRGYQQFLFPPPLPNEPKAHDWTFLKPVTTLNTVAGTSTYTLPDDFGAMLGEMTYAVNQYWTTVRLTNENAIRDLQQRGTAQGRPFYGAVRPKAATGITGQRFELLLWPTPGAVYNLTYRYIPDVSALDGTTNVYPWGGMPHSETLLESCLSIAEQRNDDDMGLHTRKFMERLAASVAFDKRLTAEYFGRNNDNSDNLNTPRPVRIDYVTYNNVPY